MKADYQEMELPCSNCIHTRECEIKAIECVAARQWYQSGKFLDGDKGRLRRKIK